jgi:poly-gamma-glutamate system protein
MKKIYWRPHRVSNTALFLIAALSIAGLIAVERIKVKTKQRFYDEKLVAARLTRNAMEVIKQERLKRGIPIDPEVDPSQSGLIGVSMSPVTSDTGFIQAKHCSINPNWAAVLVHLLKLAGCKEGDFVGVGPSGSFPVINMAAYAAIQTLKLKPIIISSAAASQFGANIPDLLWIHMERILFERHIFTFRSVAASRGGVDDRGFGMPKEARKLLDDAIVKEGLQLIDVKTTTEGTDRRMQIYAEQAGGQPIKAYINIGGGSASVGSTVAKKLFKPGLNRTAPRGAASIDSVMSRFANEGVPVIHMIYVAELAQRYGLPLQPLKVPNIGEGAVFSKQEYNVYLAIAVLAVILLAMFAFIRMDIGFRILRSAKRDDKAAAHPEQMV